MKTIIPILLVFLMISSMILAGCSGALSSATPQPELTEIQGATQTNQEQFLPQETDKMKNPPTGGQQEDAVEFTESGVQRVCTIRASTNSVYTNRDIQGRQRTRPRIAEEGIYPSWYKSGSWWSLWQKGL